MTLDQFRRAAWPKPSHPYPDPSIDSALVAWRRWMARGIDWGSREMTMRQVASFREQYEQKWPTKLG